MTPDTAPVTPGLWLSISDLARERGLAKQTVAAKVARFEGEGLLATRSGGKGRPKMVNAAAYDRAVGATGDAIRIEAAQAIKARSAPADEPVTPQPMLESTEPGTIVLSAEQAKRALYQAEMARLDLEERLGKLIPVEDVTAAMLRCAEAMVRKIEQISSRADDLSAAVARDGVAGGRAFLKEVARSLRDGLAAEMRLLSAEPSASTSTAFADDDGEAA